MRGPAPTSRNVYGYSPRRWDPDKAASNLSKHGVSFADAVAVVEDEFTLMGADDFPDEERCVVLGADAFG
ncbi:MAG TPA: BrnT family toxin [Roseiflexaceae bacterium]|nr:BrnT family toxin [Roseiflexaceae bacterium]